jgi:hypothetical protein
LASVKSYEDKREVRKREIEGTTLNLKAELKKYTEELLELVRSTETNLIKKLDAWQMKQQEDDDVDKHSPRLTLLKREMYLLQGIIPRSLPLQNSQTYSENFHLETADGITWAPVGREIIAKVVNYQAQTKETQETDWCIRVTSSALGGQELSFTTNFNLNLNFNSTGDTASCFTIHVIVPETCIPNSTITIKVKYHGFPLLETLVYNVPDCFGRISNFLR